MFKSPFNNLTENVLNTTETFCLEGQINQTKLFRILSLDWQTGGKNMANLPISMSNDRPCSGQFITALGSQAFNCAFQTVCQTTWFFMVSLLINDCKYMSFEF